MEDDYEWSYGADFPYAEDVGGARERTLAPPFPPGPSDTNHGFADLRANAQVEFLRSRPCLDILPMLNENRGWVVIPAGDPSWQQMWRRIQKPGFLRHVDR